MILRALHSVKTAMASARKRALSVFVRPASLARFFAPMLNFVDGLLMFAYATRHTYALKCDVSSYIADMERHGQHPFRRLS